MPESVTAPSTATSSDNGIPSSTADTSAYIDDLQLENRKLQETLTATQHNYEHVTAQLQQLHGHYAQLHSAYTSISESAASQSQQPQSGSAENQKQIQQHFQTIGILVEEKTELQSQLRQAMEIANAKHVENEELQGRLKANRERLAELEKDAEGVRSGRNALEATLNKQKEELDRRRVESSQWEAKVVEMQQDRSDMQARLKVKARELDRVQAELGDARKQMQMKDIYIRQLNAHAAGVAQQQQHEDAVNAVQAESDQLKVDLHNAKTAADHWKREAEQSREQYESYGRQLNQKIVQLSAEVERLMEERLTAEAKATRLQQQLEAAQPVVQPKPVENGVEDIDSEPDAGVREAMQHVALVEARQQLADQTERLSQLEISNHQYSEELLKKSADLEDAKEQLQQCKERLVRLEDDLKLRDQISSDARSLLDQLQSEKATVSRAVAQNRELKEQLTELQDKFVALSQENMERETKVQSSEYAIDALQKQFIVKEDAVAKLEKECQSLREQLGLVMQQSMSDGTLEQQLAEERRSVQYLQAQLNDARNKTTVEEEGAEKEHAAVQNSSAEEIQQKQWMEEEMTRLRGEIERLEEALRETRMTQRRATSENEELHRIMQQNAEDENQNTIHVELQHALDRITSLSTENDRLRQAIEDSHSGHTSPTPAPAPVHVNGNGNGVADDRSSVCSEHGDKRRDNNSSASLESLHTAMTQLQSRFTRAMTENADLADQNQQLEHLILHLQSETDTIGEYVTIYQHQRKVIRERLRERDECVAKLSREKASMQRKLTELQDLVMSVLNEKGVLHSYSQQSAPTRGRRPNRPKAAPTKRATKPRSFSQTTVDELSGDEEMVVDGTHDNIPYRSTPLNGQIDENGDVAIVAGEGEGAGNEIDPEVAGDAGEEVAEVHLSPQSSTHSEDGFESGATERILRLLTELQAPHLADRLPIVDPKLHCKECRGKLITI
uniref:Golgin subfamily A conserved domain-containing protein n=1 Tax=Plectus sambesii TaxID=2011161 RepID=A0A914XFB8_9BILA